MTIKEVAENWILNADTSDLTPIDIKTARQYVSWMDPDQTPEDMTPEAFMNAYNSLVRT